MSGTSTTSTYGVSGYTTVWTETFDTGLGRVGHSWGHVWVHDGVATISSWAGEWWQPSGMMQQPTDATAGQGYGLYSVTMQIYSYAPGAFACLWPSSDVWPGPELDLIEIDFNGNAYSTLHWKGTDGSDSYVHYYLNGIDARQVHTYSLEWADTYLKMYVDGVLMWTDTTHVPKDFAHGGENASFGVGQQPGWAAGYQNGDNVLDVLEMSYAAPTGTGGGTSTPQKPTPVLETAPAAKFGSDGNWNRAADVWEGKAAYGGVEYHTFGSMPNWGSLKAVESIATKWSATHATHLAYDNFVTARLDFNVAGATALDLMVVSAKNGLIRTGAGSDTITWVAHSNGGNASANTMVIRAGNGDDTIHITAAGLTSLADYDKVDNGSLYNARYDGRSSTAEVYVGEGRDVVTTDGAVRLVLQAGGGHVIADGGSRGDLFRAGAGTAEFTGGGGNDIFEFRAGNGHVVIEDFSRGADKLRFIGLNASGVTSRAAVEDGVSGLLVTYDAAGDSVFLAHVGAISAKDMIFA